jgi:hypothetical protein
MSLYLPNRSKYGVASAPGTSTTITLGTLVPSFLPLPAAASDQPVVYYAEDTIGGAAVCEIGDATLKLSGGTWTLSNRNPYEQSNGTTSLLSLTSAALIGFSMRAGDFFGFPAGFVNKFRNGCMDIWQRGTSMTVTTAAAAYTLDGWIVGASGTSASCTITQDATRSNDENLIALKLMGGSGITGTAIWQNIESFVAAPLAGKVCTAKFKVYNGKASGTLTPTITVAHASLVDNFSTVITDLASTNLQVCANVAWTTVAYTFVANVATINGLRVQISFGALGASDFVEVTSCDLRETPFSNIGLCATPQITEKRPFAIEMIFCQRYFFSTYNNGVAPGTAGQPGAVTTTFNNVGVWTIYNYFRFPVTMRIPPSFSYWDQLGNSGVLSASSSTGGLPSSNNFTNTSGTFSASVSTHGVIMQGTSGVTAIFYAQFTASSEL